MTVVGRAFAPHCSVALFALKFHLLDHVVKNLETLERFAFADAAQFEHFNELIERPYTYETLQNMSRAPGSVRIEESQVHGGVVAASLLKNEKCAEDSRSTLYGMASACHWSSCQRQLREQKRLCI